MASAIQKARSLLNVPGISASALSHISNLIPPWANFIGTASAIGYTADEIMNFLRDQATTPEEKREKAMLTRRAESNQATPSERVSLQLREQEPSRTDLLQGALRLGTGIAAGLGALGAGNSPASPDSTAFLSQPPQIPASPQQKQISAPANQKNQPGVAAPVAAQQAIVPDKIIDTSRLDRLDTLVQNLLPQVSPKDMRQIMIDQVGKPTQEAYEASRGRLEELKARLPKKETKPGKKQKAASTAPSVRAEQLDLFNPPAQSGIPDPVIQAVNAVLKRLGV